MTQHDGVKVPAEHPDPKAAAGGPKPGAEDRPGFDLGGSSEGDNDTGVGSSVIPGGPRGSPGTGVGGTGRAGGSTDVSGSRSMGGGGTESGSQGGSGQ